MQGRTITFLGKTIQIVDHREVPFWGKLPYCLRVLLENGLRQEPDHSKKWLDAFAKWFEGEYSEINFYPSRVLMQDLTGVPALVDLAAMRDAMVDKGGKASQVNPQCQVDLVVDHSLIVDHVKDPEAFAKNVALEVKRNKERYAFLKWAQGSFSKLRIVPPGKGICHQVNLEYLANVVTEENGWWYPDTLVGLDSHTTMINGLGVLAWGVGGIEAEAAMLGQPITMKIPSVLGVELKGKLSTGVSATDMVLHLTQKLRQHGVVGKFLEFVGEGVSSLTLAERATIANMAPEYGATCAYFPQDKETLAYLHLTAREEEHIKRVETYLKEMDMFWQGEIPTYTEMLSIDLAEVESCIAGPKTPDEKIVLSGVKESLGELQATANPSCLSDASVVIAAITSCTNTSNPSVLIGAGLLARKAREKGLSVPSWVKPSFAPGSRVVMDYLKELDLVKDLEALGFYLVGYGCTTCIGNSGPLDIEVSQAIDEMGLKVAAVLSGNRNFEGRVHPKTQLNYLASPLLVVAYALSGTMAIDFEKEPLGGDVYLKDIWPSEAEIQKAMKSIASGSFKKEYATIFEGEADWKRIQIVKGESYFWDDDSTYIRKPPFFEEANTKTEDIIDGSILAVFGNKVTTDHISPAGTIAVDSAASDYLQSRGVAKDALHSYGARRGNAEVMVRGTFANIRLVNTLAPKNPGGFTTYRGKLMRIYDAAMASKNKMVIFAGKDYGMGSSRDWAAKGTRLLGVSAIIANSFERIHRSNLIGMGVLPCVLKTPTEELGLTGTEKISIMGIDKMNTPNAELVLIIESTHDKRELKIMAAINTQKELDYYRSGGILPYVLNQVSKDKV